MRSKVRILLVSWLVGIGVTGSGQGQSLTRGRIVDSHTGLPLVGVTLKATNIESRQEVQAQSKTDNDGRFVFRLHSGTYVVTIIPPPDIDRKDVELQSDGQGGSDPGSSEVVKLTTEDKPVPSDQSGSRYNSLTVLPPRQSAVYLLALNSDPPGATARIGGNECETPCTIRYVAFPPAKVRVQLRYQKHQENYTWDEVVDLPVPAREATWADFRWQKPTGISWWRHFPIFGEIYTKWFRPKAVQIQGYVSVDPETKKGRAKIGSEYRGKATVISDVSVTPMQSERDLDYKQLFFGVSWSPDDPKHEAWRVKTFDTLTDADTKIITILWREIDIGWAGFGGIVKPQRLGGRFSEVEIGVGVD